MEFVRRAGRRTRPPAVAALAVLAALAGACKDDERGGGKSGLPPGKSWQSPETEGSRVSGAAPASRESPAPEPASSQPGSLEERRQLLKWTALAQPGSLRLSSDSRVAAFVARLPPKQHLVIYNKKLRPYDAIRADTIALSADGRHLVYAAARDDAVFVVHDGEEGPPHDGVHESTVAISPDGARHAYGFRDGDRSFVMVDGERFGPYDEIVEDTPIFSADSARWSFGAARDGNWFVVVDGEEGPAADGIGAGGARFSPDSARVAYMAEKGDRSRVFVDGEPQRAVEGLWSQGMIFSRQGRIAYAANLVRGDWGVIVDGRVVARARWTFDVVFSPDGDRFAYGAGDGEAKWVVEDGEAGARYEGLGGITMDPAGRTAYAAMADGRWTVVHAGEAHGFWDEIGDGSIVFAKKGERLAFLGRDGEHWYVVVDGERIVEADAIVARSLAFTPDGERIAYAYIRDGKSRVVVGSAESRPYELVLFGDEGLVFDDEGRTHYVAGEKYSMYLVSAAAR